MREDPSNIRTDREGGRSELEGERPGRGRGSDTMLMMLAGVGLGAAAMYFLDPGGGPRRRALVRDKATHTASLAESAAGTTARDLRNRARGAVAGTRSKLRREDVDDARLEARVRTALGRVTSHPGPIRVFADDGHVILSGPILAHEAEAVVAAARKVKGVSEVEDRLDRHERAGHVSALQGGTPRSGSRPEALARNWSPATRIMAGAAGAALLARAMTNLEFRRMVGMGGQSAMTIQKTLTLRAPADEVWEFWSDYQNFPHFMSHVREVQDHGDGRSHWVVDGPAGMPVEWDAEITELVPGQVIAWRSVPGSVVNQAGRIRFQEMAGGATRVDLQLSYSPPGGAVGHGIATLFGVDPKRQIDGDLARVKNLIETGRPARDAAAPITPGAPAGGSAPIL